MTYTQKQKEITDKAVAKQVKLIKKTVKKQEPKLVSEIEHLVLKTFTDTTYSNAVSSAVINEIGIDYGCLDDILDDEYMLNDSSSCLVYAKVTLDNVIVNVNAWVILEDNMTFRNGDFRLASENFDIDHDALRPNSDTFVAECLKTIREITTNV